MVTAGVTSFVHARHQGNAAEAGCKDRHARHSLRDRPSVVATPVLLPNRPSLRLNRDAGIAVSGGQATSLRTTAWHHPARVVGVASPAIENTVLTAQADGLVRFWDSVTGRHERAVDVTASRAGTHSPVRYFAISPDGRYLGAAGFVKHDDSAKIEATVWIWSMQGNEPLRKIDLGLADLQCLAFSPDGATVATGAGREAKLWDIATGECLDTIELVPIQSLFSLSFTPDGDSLATIEQGAGIKIWNLERREASLIPIPLIGGNTVYFSPDDRYIAFGTYDEVLATWNHLVIWAAFSASSTYRLRVRLRGSLQTDGRWPSSRWERREKRRRSRLSTSRPVIDAGAPTGAGHRASGCQFCSGREDDLRGVGQRAEIVRRPDGPGAAVQPRQATAPSRTRASRS